MLEPVICQENLIIAQRVTGNILAYPWGRGEKPNESLEEISCSNNRDKPANWCRLNKFFLNNICFNIFGFYLLGVESPLITCSFHRVTGTTYSVPKRTHNRELEISHISGDNGLFRNRTNLSPPWEH